MIFTPHVTVATVVEHEGNYLMVEELSEGNLVYNQPAGHLDANETLEEAAVRETLEETGWHVELLGVVGIALYTSALNNTTYNRTTFFAKALKREESPALDDGIQQAIWLSYEEIKQQANKLRSPLVIRAIEQYQNGHRYPLSLIYR